MTSNNRSKANFDVNSFGGRYWCDDCKKYVTNNKTSRKNHETNVFHLENRKKRIEAMNKTHSEQRAEADIARKEFLRISASADKAYEKDLKGIMNPCGVDGKPIKVIPSKPLHNDPQLEPMPQELIDKQRAKFAKRERARDIREGVYREEEEPVIVKEEISLIPADFKAPSQLLPKQENDTMGVAGEWKEVSDYVESGYYSNYYKPTGSSIETQTTQQYSSYIKSENGIKTGQGKNRQIDFSKNNNNNNKKEKEEIEEDDGFGCLSNAAIQNISHEQEARPDSYQVSKLNRLNNDSNPEEGVMFKKRKLNKGQGRKTTATQKDDL